MRDGLDEKIKELREILTAEIEIDGLNAENILKISQELDKLIAEYYK